MTKAKHHNDTLEEVRMEEQKEASQNRYNTLANGILKHFQMETSES